jgi:hypothetical protein
LDYYTAVRLVSVIHEREIVSTPLASVISLAYATSWQRRSAVARKTTLRRRTDLSAIAALLVELTRYANVPVPVPACYL